MGSSEQNKLNVLWDDREYVSRALLELYERIEDLDEAIGRIEEHMDKVLEVDSKTLNAAADSNKTMREILKTVNIMKDLYDQVRAENRALYERMIELFNLVTGNYEELSERINDIRYVLDEVNHRLDDLEEWRDYQDYYIGNGVVKKPCDKGGLRKLNEATVARLNADDKWGTWGLCEDDEENIDTLASQCPESTAKEVKKALDAISG